MLCTIVYFFRGGTDFDDQLKALPMTRFDRYDEEVERALHLYNTQFEAAYARYEQMQTRLTDRMSALEDVRFSQSLSSSILLVALKILTLLLQVKPGLSYPVTNALQDLRDWAERKRDSMHYQARARELAAVDPCPLSAVKFDYDMEEGNKSFSRLAQVLPPPLPAFSSLTILSQLLQLLLPRLTPPSSSPAILPSKAVTRCPSKVVILLSRAAIRCLSRERILPSKAATRWPSRAAILRSSSPTEGPSTAPLATIEQ